VRASHIKTFPGHGSFTSSNLVGEAHVPRNAPGTPQANARFRPTRTHARSADESEGMRVRRVEEREESGGACAQRAGSGQKQGGLGENGVPGQANAPLAPGRSGRPSGTLPALLSGGPIPPDPLGEKSPRPPRNQRCDPAGPAAVAEMPGPIRWDTAPSWSPHNPRTPACAYY
jgi:hypothetical protein